MRNPPGFRAFRIGQESLLPKPTHKVCSVCGELKPLTDFVKRWQSPDGYAGRCKECKSRIDRANYTTENGRKRWLQYKFGITQDDLDFMFDAQNGKCAICGQSDSTSRLSKNKAEHGSVFTLHIDHLGGTKEIRGLLCGPCNRGIGMFYDDPELLEKAIEYLRNWRENTPALLLDRGKESE